MAAVDVQKVRKIYKRDAQDIVAAYRAPEFQKLFQANPAWAGYRLPDYFRKD